MIRPATPTDTPIILELAVAAGLFARDEAGPVHEVILAVHAGQAGAGHAILVWADDAVAAPAGVSYFGPDALADRKWDLWMIAVAPARQGRGIGGELVAAVEAHARADGGRLMVIDTSSKPQYDPTRAFYRKHGYAEVARIPDFYADGDAKVIYTKRLSPTT